MAGDTPITLTGNIVDDEIGLRFTPGGRAAATFRVASTPRYYDRKAGEWRDGDTLFLTVVAYGPMAENAAESLTRGTRVIVSGRLKQRSYDDRDGVKRTVYEIEADEIGPSLRNATAKVNKTTRAAGGGGEANPWDRSD